MNGSIAPGGGLPYTERHVAALLDSQGSRLYWYFWMMLGDQTSVTRALAGTVIVAVPDPGHLQLFEVAHAVCRQHHPAPAIPHARPEAPTLAAATRAALRRLEPSDREVCVLGAAAYRLNDADLTAVLRTRATEELWRRAMDAFAIQLAACAADAGIEQGEDLVERALRLFGVGQFAVPYAEIVALAIDPAAEWLRAGIRSRVAVPNRAVASQGGMTLLGAGSHQSVTVHGIEDAELVTVPLPRVPRKNSQRAVNRRRGAMAGSVLAAGVIPVAIAVAWAGSGQATHVAAVPPLSAIGGSTIHGAGAPAHGPANGTANPSHQYRARHARPEPGTQAAGTSGASGALGTSGTSGTSQNVATTSMAGSAAAPAGTTSTSSSTSTSTSTPPLAAAPAPTTTTPAPVPPVLVTTTTTTHGNGGVGMGNGNGNTNGNGNGGVGNGTGIGNTSTTTNGNS